MINMHTFVKFILEQCNCKKIMIDDEGYYRLLKTNLNFPMFLIISNMNFTYFSFIYSLYSI